MTRCRHWSVTRTSTAFLRSAPNLLVSTFSSTSEQTPGAKTIKKNTNSTQNKFQTHRARQYEVTSFLSTDCELSTETCSKNVYSLGPRVSVHCQTQAWGQLHCNVIYCYDLVPFVLLFMTCQIVHITIVFTRSHLLVTTYLK